METQEQLFDSSFKVLSYSAFGEHMLGIDLAIRGENDRTYSLAIQTAALYMIRTGEIADVDDPSDRIPVVVIADEEITPGLLRSIKRKPLSELAEFLLLLEDEETP